MRELEDALLTISKRFTIDNNMLRDCNDPENVFPAMEMLLEVLFVDDGSTDGTARILSEYARSRPYVKILASTRNQGQTHSFKKAFAEIKGQYVVRLDSDLQNDPKDLITFFHNFILSPDLVIGLRSPLSRLRRRRIFGAIYDLLCLLLFATPLNTNTSNFVAFRSTYMRNLNIVGNDHRYLPIIALHRGATHCIEIIILNRPRRFGQSHYSTYLKYILGIPEFIRFLIRLKTGLYGKVDHTL